MKISDFIFKIRKTAIEYNIQQFYWKIFIFTILFQPLIQLKILIPKNINIYESSY